MNPSSEASSSTRTPGRQLRTRVHDSQTQIRSDGIGPRLFDPATKKDVRVDQTGAVLGDRDEP